MLLGVVEYLHRPLEALRKIAASTPHVVLSYCCCLDSGTESLTERSRRGWTNAITEHGLRTEMEALGFRVSGRQTVNSTAYFEQIILQLER